jgi:hypothetical protein
MSFETTLSTHFPGALFEADFVARTAAVLGTHGFTKGNAIACVAVCRDELTRPLAAQIERTWGEAFNFSGLAGMLFLGKTGFGAAQHHAPNFDGRERYVFFALPHIAIGANGEIGLCQRAGRSGPSNACGALAALQKALQQGLTTLEIDQDDLEMSWLRRRLATKLSVNQKPDLLALTRLAYDAILEDLERTVSQTVKTDHADYGVITGVQVHGPGINYTWPGTMYAMVNGKRHNLSLR